MHIRGQANIFLNPRVVRMAWHCSGRSNTELVENMFQRGVIASAHVRDAMLKVDRAHFTRDSPYTDAPQAIGYGATISAPHMHASAAEALLPFLRRGARVLDIGSGSGYLTAVLAEVVFAAEGNEEGGGEGKEQEKYKDDGIVIGIEHIPALRDLAWGNISQSPRGAARIRRGEIKLIVGDGRHGWRDDDEQGWDAIHVGAAAAEFHNELVSQLRTPGRLFIPVEDEKESQWIWLVDKRADGSITRTRREPVRYVPLTDAPMPMPR